MEGVLVSLSYEPLGLFDLNSHKLKFLLLVWQAKAQEETDQVHILIRQLQSRDAVVRISVADALGRIGPEAKEAAPALIAALKDQDAFIRNSAAEALGEIGPGTKEAAPALIGALKDRDAGVRRSAAKALEKIDPDNPSIRKAL